MQRKDWQHAVLSVGRTAADFSAHGFYLALQGTSRKERGDDDTDSRPFWNAELTGQKATPFATADVDVRWRAGDSVMGTVADTLATDTQYSALRMPHDRLPRRRDSLEPP